jgi:hypothetical protein
MQIREAFGMTGSLRQPTAARAARRRFRSHAWEGASSVIVSANA